MSLEQLYPNNITSSPEQRVQEVMRGVLVRTNFVPGVRHVIGWRGLKESFTSVEGWTSKIKGFSGVFGMYFDAFEEYEDWLKGKFDLLYFPDPQEELIEHYSLQAVAYAQREDYLKQIRNFLLHPQLCELFKIGFIDLCIDKVDHSLILGLKSVSHDRVIAKDGVSILHQARLVELIKPGGYDQNFPSYETALAFFQVLSASFTFNLEAPPLYMKYYNRPGKENVYDASGCHWEISSGDSHEESLYLGYGQSGFKNIMKIIIDNRIVAGEDITWEKGKNVIPKYKDALWWNAHQISDFKTLDKNILGIDERPQLIILTGFLGSGKTSFLQHFIEYQDQLNRFVAVIQNEIGEIGLDGKLLDHDYAVTEIDEGCICCSLVGNLKSAIHQILSSFHPDYIIIETTGLANPYNLLDEINELDELVRFDSITTIVDGFNIEQSLKEYDVVREQIKAADILLVNKKDLLNEIQLPEIKKTLKGINPAAPVLLTENGDINPALLYDVDPQDEPGEKYRKKLQDKTHLTHHSHEFDGLSSHRISFTDALGKKQFIKAIQTLPSSVFRIKGVVEFADVDKPTLVQYVGGRFDFSDFNNPKMKNRFLVFIGQNIRTDSISSFEILRKSISK